MTAPTPPNRPAMPPPNAQPNAQPQASRGPNGALANNPLYIKITEHKPMKRAPWKPEWNGYIVEALDRIAQHDPDGVNRLMDDIPDDFNSLYPGGLRNKPEAVRKAAWGVLMSGIIAYESGYDPTVTGDKSRMTEGHSDPSLSLFQLSNGSVRYYKGCGFAESWNYNNIINNERSQFHCAAMILNRQLDKSANKRDQGRLFTPNDNPFYWSVLSTRKDEIIQIFKEHIPQLQALETAIANGSLPQGPSTVVRKTAPGPVPPQQQAAPRRAQPSSLPSPGLNPFGNPQQPFTTNAVSFEVEITSWN